MMRRALIPILFVLALAPLFAQGNEPFRQPKGHEVEQSVAEQNPMSPPPPASANWPLSQVDPRVIAVFSLLWAFAIVLAMGALLRAEATDDYHDSRKDALRT